MTGDEGRVTQLAAAVLDGTPVDWAAAESEADGAGLPLVKHLRVVAALAEVHRTLTPKPTTTSAPAGTTLECWGHLRLIEKIGCGTFGEVYRAWDTRLDREVALKLLPADRTASDRAASSIIHEGRLLARVRQPNVATIYGAEQIGDRIGLWMEFVRGRTLEQMLEQGTVFSATEAARIGLDLCRAVSAVHAADLLHRDIKAHNVMLADDGRVVLMDFGTGRELDDSSSSDLAGTPLYVAPEVLGGLPATVQSDVYSLGVLLYHLVTGSYPVRGRTIRDIRLAHERNERTDLRTLRLDVRPALARVIERASDPQPERRYANVDTLARDLVALQRRPGIMRLTYGLAAVATVLLVAGVAWDVRGRLAGDQRSLGSRLASLIAGTVGAPSPIEHPVIAVLPFKNLSTEPGNDNLVDSLTAGLIQQLALIKGLEVKSQTSSFKLKGTSRNLSDVGQQLGVNLVVEGWSIRSGSTLRVNAQLVLVASDAALWTHTFDRELSSASDLFAILDDITRAIVNQLRLQLGPTQRRYDTDLATYDVYLKARVLQARHATGAREAIPLFEYVIEKDPSFAPAHAALASTYGILSNSFPVFGDFAIPPAEAAAKMRPLVLKAIALDPQLAEAHAAMGYLHALDHEWTAAEQSYRHSLELNPTLTTTYTDFVLSTLMPWGRLDDALSTLNAALNVDPLSLDVRRTMATVQLSAGLYDEALDNCQRVLAVDPDFPFAEEWCGRAFLQKGEIAEALARFGKNPDRNEGWIAHVYSISGRRAEAEALATKNAHFPQRQALIYAGLGDKDRTFAALDALAALNARRAGSYLTYPEFAILRGDPRVAALRQKLGFPR